MGGADDECAATTTPPSQQRAKASAGKKSTRDSLLEAAEQILLEEGAHALTIRRVGAISGLNSTLITYHFGTVSGLLAELCRCNLAPMVAEWRSLPETIGSLDAILERWLRPLTRPAAFTQEGRALVVLDEIATHADPVLGGAVMSEMMETGERVRSLLAPLFPELDEAELRARLRFIAGGALGPPPRNRSKSSAAQAQPPLDSADRLISFAKAALRP